MALVLTKVLIIIPSLCVIIVWVTVNFSIKGLEAIWGPEKQHSRSESRRAAWVGSMVHCTLNSSRAGLNKVFLEKTRVCVLPQLEYIPRYFNAQNSSLVIKKKVSLLRYNQQEVMSWEQSSTFSFDVEMTVTDEYIVILWWIINMVMLLWNKLLSKYKNYKHLSIYTWFFKGYLSSSGL